MHKRKNNVKEKGAALIVVLFIVMIATILSFGFLARSDAELACGSNMLLKTQMDYLAESGLEYAKGIMAGDSNLAENWAAVGRQLYGGNDYYDVNVALLALPDPNQPVQTYSYRVISTAYRDKNGRKVGESTLKAELYVDPSAGALFRRITR